ncbi:MAG: histidine--tRNA ligase [bacterium]|nr:histidine--tRNA ligase [bacterium]
MKINILKGMYDVLPDDAAVWQVVEQVVRDVCGLYGFGEIRTPVMEKTELFERGVGKQTDIVKKEMYTFEDKGGRSITLRPEGTASVVRAYLESGLCLSQGEPAKFFYIAPMFRYERPQAGRFRQHVQFGAEYFGVKDPVSDAETVLLLLDIYKRLGIEYELNINNVGCGKKDCRNSIRDGVKEYFGKRLQEMCEDCRARYETNPLRILDCKKETCMEISKGFKGTGELSCGDCRQYYAGIKKSLDSSDVRYSENPKLVRGLDYYTTFVFEVLAPGLGAQNSVGGGGRYDSMVKELGGPDVPAVGFGSGIERVILAMKSQNPGGQYAAKPKIFVVFQGEKAYKEILPVMSCLRDALGVTVNAVFGKSLKAQMRAANKSGSVYTLIIGDSEIEKKKYKLKNMETGEEKEINAGEIKNLKGMLGV